MPLDQTSILSPAPSPAAPSRAGGRLSAVVLLAGEVRRTGLSRAAARSRLDLPISAVDSLGSCWHSHVVALRAALGQPRLPMFIAANTAAPIPRTRDFWQDVTVALDREEPRGSGGALRDISVGLDPDSYILVASAHSYPRTALTTVAGSLLARGSDVVIHADPGGAPSGIFLMRCGALEGVGAKGFVDLKEQAMPQIASQHEVVVLKTADAPPIPIWTLDGYVRAARAAALIAGDAVSEEPEDWHCAFRLIEPGSDVHPTAKLHDAVILAGARVGAGAVVVRSLVGPGAVVRAGGSAIDELVGGEEGPR